ncbi:LOW QUALITY PROTEIN: hypothetical protein ACHAWO_009990 [Cyclotella atomus]|uniref:Uncharacterized protein n=1 Tax=Cyclotella atomus TaxID=382360 RepID=A0ABD3QHM1_9STRA
MTPGAFISFKRSLCVYSTSFSSSSIIANRIVTKCKNSSLKRYVSSISSTENSTEHAYFSFQSQPQVKEGKTLLAWRMRHSQRDGSLMHGSSPNQASGLIVDISLDVDEEEKHEEALMELDLIIVLQYLM